MSRGTVVYNTGVGTGGLQMNRQARMERLDVFSNAVFIADVPGAATLNRDLCLRLLEEESKTPGLQLTNYGGWHSTRDLMDRSEQCFRAVVELILDQAGRASAELTPSVAQASIGVATLRMVHAWAMIMRQGDCTIAHDHGDADWSVVYYVDVGDSKEGERSGALAFIDSRPDARSVGPLDRPAPTFTFQPRSGLLVVFPGSLKHQVHTYEGERPRISISANLVEER